MPRAGNYDQPIVIRARGVSGENTYGEDTPGIPFQIASLWAAVIPLSGRELQAVAQIWAEARYEIRFHWQPLTIVIKREHYIEWRGQTLDILDIRGPGTREAEWTIIAKDHVE